MRFLVSDPQVDADARPGEPWTLTELIAYLSTSDARLADACAKWAQECDYKSHGQTFYKSTNRGSFSVRAIAETSDIVAALSKLETLALAHQSLLKKVTSLIAG